MATEIVYADLDLGPGERCGKRRSPHEAGSPGCPRWHRVALGAGWTGNLLLGVAVLALGCSFLHRQPESPGSCRIGRVGDGNSSRDNFVLELREVLCPSQPPGPEGCRICRQGWTLGRNKCYWVSSGYSPWNESREDCGDRGATLLLPRDPDELELLDETLHKSGRSFWIGLWEPEPGTGWTWLNGSRLHRDRFQPDLGEGRGQCGTIKGNRIGSETCSTALRWICQREATKI